MSNDIVPAFQPKPLGPEFNKLREHFPALGEGIVTGFPVIGYRGKNWSLRYRGQNYPFVREDDGTPLSYIDIIIVGNNPVTSKAYYPEWDEDNTNPPVCFAMDVSTGPDPGVEEPQAKSCTVCPHNQFTTLKTGMRGKECQDHRRLAVLLMPNMTRKMIGSPLKEACFLKIPPGSLTTLKTYGDWLEDQGLIACSVITRVAFNPDPKKLFQLTFKPMQQLSDKQAPMITPYTTDPQVLRIIGKTPQIYEVEKRDEPKRVKRQEEEPVGETGIEEAFGADEGKKSAPKQTATAPGKGRGRPPGSKNKPKTNGQPEAKEDPVEQLEVADQAAASQEEDSVSSGPELDESLKELMDEKVANMLK